METTTTPRQTLRDQQRREWSERASYYAWMARRSETPRVDPLTGERWSSITTAAARRLGRAMYIALAREAFAVARTFGPVPLP
jgi:hypothetical protein